jgi:NAD-reducing hydrogenase large subunit
MTAATTGRKVVINPVTRVEGHGKVTLHLDASGHINEARFHIVEFRGFERFIQGRPYWEAPTVVQRLCGICPVSHHLCASKAMDGVVGVGTLSTTAEKMRRLMHYGQTFQSHVLHFYHLASPDLLFGFDAPVENRNVIGVLRAHPDIARKAILMRKYGQEVIRVTSGKKIHGTGSVPGGINKNLSVEERDSLLVDVDEMIAWAVEGLEGCKSILAADRKRLMAFGTVNANFVSIVSDDGGLDLYDGNLRARNANGEIIFDQLPPEEYANYIREEVRPWSYMKFPFIKSLGKGQGWYRVGPLARINNCDYIDTPIAEAERVAFMALGGGTPIQSTMAYHWARMIETVHAAEKIKELLHDPDLQGEDLIRQGRRRGAGMAWIEAPRGTLIHHYEVDAQDLITRANLIVSTTHNNEAMNRSVLEIARSYLDGKEITEALLNHIEVGIRAYDPCLSCATHALGQMRLQVQLVGPDDAVITERTRS